MSSTTYTISNKDSSSYEEGYKVFLKRSNFREKVIEKFSDLASKIFQDQTTLSVLDVGCGNGLMTQRYIRELKRISPIIKLSLLEPAEQSLESAVQLLSPEVFTIETKANISELAPSNLIIASYVFYHLSPESLDDICEHLTVNGYLAIMMGTNNHPLKSHPSLKEVSSHGSSDKLNPFIETLERSKSFQVSRYPIETSLELNGLWENEVFTSEAKTLLSFSLNKNFQDLSKQALDALNEIFKSAFESTNGSLNPIHEIILIERLK